MSNTKKSVVYAMAGCLAIYWIWGMATSVDRYSFSEQRAQEITVGLLKDFAARGDERSATELRTWEEMNTTQFQTNRPILWKTAWSATFAANLYGRRWPVRFEMWALNRPTTIRELMRIVEHVGSGIASPAQVEEWVQRSAVQDSVWPLEKRRTLAILQSVPRTPFLYENGRWKEIKTDSFPLSAGTDVLLAKFLPGKADYGL